MAALRHIGARHWVYCGDAAVASEDPIFFRQYDEYLHGREGICAKCLHRWRLRRQHYGTELPEIAKGREHRRMLFGR